ncbi:MAG: thiamine phosphate synthase [candidate division WOR-3 bacterium]|nr:thiamine phosphate synthase [candidate division WOR-3 bacterium]MCX7947077.1 thiamine phosphate synthase [candidate division WOR-3 bacterium]MDW8149882.1 thiamine phosphate synthase [candidate division WOR-3 bacterium]
MELYMIRKGIYAITDEFLIKDSELEQKVERAIIGGASIIQLRDKYLDYSKKLERARRIRKITKKYGVLFIINDDPILAKEVRADGVHLGKDEEYYLKFAREMLRDKIIGVSCYGDIERALFFQKLGVNYVAFGSVFPTKTKDSETIKTIEIFRWARSLLNIPIIAIGGINKDNYKILVDMGVNIIAMVSAIFDGDPYENLRNFKL